MVNYQNGKIYKLHSKNYTYIGSTTQPLWARKAGHVWDYKCWKAGTQTYSTSFKVIDDGEYQITLLEDYPCERKEQLQARERHWIESYGETVNKCIPTRTYAEWREVNAESIKARMKDYRQVNTEKIQANNKGYRQSHQAQISAQKKEYYKLNVETILSKQHEPYHCPCGRTIRRHSKAKHERSMRHTQWAATNNV